MPLPRVPFALTLALALLAPFAIIRPEARAQSAPSGATAAAASQITPVPYFSDPAVSPDAGARPRRDRVRLRRRHLDCARVGRRGSAARLAPGDRGAPRLRARRAAARLHLDPHRQRRHLRPHLRHGRVEARHLRRRVRGARRLVARRSLALLLFDEPRHLRHERHLPRLERGRHADAGERRPLHERVLLVGLARRQIARLHGARHVVRAVVAQRAQSPRRVGNLGLARHRRGDPARELRARDRRRRERDVAHVGRGRAHHLLRLGQGRRAERLEARARSGGAAGHEVR